MPLPSQLRTQIEVGIQLKKMPEPNVQHEVVVTAGAVNANPPPQIRVHVQTIHYHDVQDIVDLLLDTAGCTALMCLADEVAGFPGTIAALAMVELAQQTQNISPCIRTWNTVAAAGGLAIAGMLQPSMLRFTIGATAAVGRLIHHVQNDHLKPPQL